MHPRSNHKLCLFIVAPAQRVSHWLHNIHKSRSLAVLAEIFKKVPSAHALYQLLPNTFLTKNHWIDGQHLAIISRELTVLLKVMESEVNIKEYLHVNWGSSVAEIMS